MDILYLYRWCLHQKQTTPRRDERGEYRRCLECGRRIPWSWADSFPIRSPKLSQPPAASALGQLAVAVWKPGRKSA